MSWIAFGVVLSVGLFFSIAGGFTLYAVWAFGASWREGAVPLIALIVGGVCVGAAIHISPFSVVLN